MSSQTAKPRFRLEELRYCSPIGYLALLRPVGIGVDLPHVIGVSYAAVGCLRQGATVELYANLFDDSSILSLGLMTKQDESIAKEILPPGTKLRESKEVIVEVACDTSPRLQRQPKTSTVI